MATMIVQSPSAWKPAYIMDADKLQVIGVSKLCAVHWQCYNYMRIHDPQMYACIPHLAALHSVIKACICNVLW